MKRADLLEIKKLLNSKTRDSTKSIKNPVNSTKYNISRYRNFAVFAPKSVKKNFKLDTNVSPGALI